MADVVIPETPVPEPTPFQPERESSRSDRRSHRVDVSSRPRAEKHWASGDLAVIAAAAPAHLRSSSAAPYGTRLPKVIQRPSGPFAMSMGCAPNFQLRLRGDPKRSPRGLGIACNVLWVIPLYGFVVTWIVLMPIMSAYMQSATNRLLDLREQEAATATGPPRPS